VSVSQGGLDPWAVQLRIGERDARFALGAILGPAPGRMMGWAAGVLPSRTDHGIIVDLKSALGVNDGLGVGSFPGQCVIDRPGQGPYICTLDHTGHMVLDDADSSNPRVDLIVARVYDERLGDPRTEFVIEPITGRPDPEPVAPPLPLAAIPLTQINLPAGTTQLTAAMVTDLRRAAGVRGGIGVLLPGDNPSEPGAYTGHTRYWSGGVESFDGQRWRSAQPIWAREADNLVVRDGISTVADILSLSVPDPGWPYRLTVQGSAEIGANNCRADLHLRLDQPDGPVFGIAFGPTNGFAWCSTQTRTTGVLTGEHAVFLSGGRVYGDGTWGNTPYNASLSVIRLPA
jgi:hypothetical protein